MESFHALVVLNLLPGIGPIRIRALEEEFGSLSTVFTRSRGELARVPGIGDKLAQQIIDPFRTIELELSRTLELLLAKENIRSAQEEEIPEGYKKLVEEYYKRLSNQRAN